MVTAATAPTDLTSAILAASGGDARVALAMLVGSNLEASYSSGAAGDNGTSFGPFQIHLPAHPGVSQGQAEDVGFAVSYMAPSYAAAVAQVPASLWTSNPEQAAEQAAVLAERPATSYFASQGQQAVDTAYSSAVQSLTAATGGTTDATLTGWLKTFAGFGATGILGNPVTGATPAARAIGTVASVLSASLSVNDLIKALLYVVFTLGGVALVVLGLARIFPGVSRTVTETVKTAAVAAA
ncbi:MAG TPA: hypothetical protein VMR97_07930 [Acidimicrobiales bacterium]|nr:hypothetical protein [Acidimicrobiales bacterium]